MRDSLLYASGSHRSATSASTRRNLHNPHPPTPAVPTSQDDSVYDTDTTSELDLSGSGDLVIDLDAGTGESESEGVAPLFASTPKQPAKQEQRNMSNFESQAIVDKGLKMKIKRKGTPVSGSSQKGDGTQSTMTTAVADGGGKYNVPDGKHVNGSKGSTGRHTGSTNKKSRNSKAQDSVSAVSGSSPLTVVTSGVGSGTSGIIPGHQSGLPSSLSQASIAAGLTGTVSVELNRLSTTQCQGPALGSNKKEPSGSINAPNGNPGDPFNFTVKLGAVKVDGLQSKKIKIEKSDVISTPSLVPGKIDTSVETSSIGIATEPDCLGPCDPGTSVMLEGIVWQETENGVLVVNVTWRGKTFVGTLLDATKNEWAPPRFSDSPTPEEVLPSGRQKRRAAAAALHDMTNCTERRLRKGRRTAANTSMPAPASPARSDTTTGRRKRGQAAVEPDPQFPETTPRVAKRGRSNSGNNEDNFPDPEITEEGAIQCPEPNCKKKYKHINGLRYHQSHAHHELSQQRHEIKSQLTESAGKVTPRGRKKRRGRADTRDIKSEPCSPTEKTAIRCSTPNSLHEATPPIDGHATPHQAQETANGLPVNHVTSDVTANVPVAGQELKELNGTIVNPQIKAVSGSRSANSSPVSGRDKKSKKKKSKDKDREHKKDRKLEALSVIKPSPLPPQLTKQPSLDKEVVPMDTTRPPSSLSVHSPSLPPNSVQSPLQVLTDSKLTKPSSMDAQSPAYSDISDANDSTLTSEPMEPLKIKEEPIDDDKHNLQQRPGAVYGQEMFQSYLRQGTPTVHQMSANGGPQTLGHGSPQPVPSSGPSLTSQSSKPVVPPQGATSHLPQGSHPNRPSSRQSPSVKELSEMKIKQEVPVSPHPDGQPRSAQDLEREYRQNMYNQYAYMAAYRFGVDPAYHQHMMNTEPNYRYMYEKHLSERKQLEEQGKLLPGQRPPPLGKPQDLSGSKGLERANSGQPGSGPPPLVSEKERVKTEPEFNAKAVDGDHSKRYYKYSGNSHGHPTNTDNVSRDTKSVIIDGNRGAGNDSVIKPPREGFRSQEQQLDFKDKRFAERTSSPKTTVDPKTGVSSPIGYGHYPGMAPGFMQSPAFGRGLPIDPSHPLLRAMNPGLMGYHNPSGALPPGFNHPPHLRYPTADEKSPGAKGPPPPEGGAKALEILQQHASQYYQNSNAPHKIHELALAEKNGDKICRDGPATSPPLRSSTPNSKGESDTPSKSDGRSPPPQRHLHTHHHTHVVGTPYNLYDPYAGGIIGGGPSANAAQPATSPSTVQHPYSSK